MKSEELVANTYYSYEVERLECCDSGLLVIRAANIDSVKQILKSRDYSDEEIEKIIPTLEILAEGEILEMNGP